MADEKTQETGTSYSAPALEKGLDVIEYLAEQEEGRSLVEISRGLERTRSEIFRMVVVLERRGLIHRDHKNDKYHLTDKLFRLGLRRPDRRQLTEVALPEMERFSSLTSQSCHLTIESEGDIVVIMRAEAPSSFGVTVRVGHRRSLVGSPSGHCMLAYQDEDRVREAFKSHTLESGRWTLAALEEDLGRIRERGYCEMRNGFVKGVIGLAAPVLDLQNRSCVAAVSSPFADLEERAVKPIAEVATALRECSERVSKSYSD